MDSELLSLLSSLLSLSHFLLDILDKNRAGVFLADSHQRTRRVIWLYMSKGDWLSLEMFYSSGRGFGRCLPRFLICRQNKFVRRHNKECVCKRHTRITAHFPSDPIILSFKRRGMMVKFAALCTNICSGVIVPFLMHFGKSTVFKVRLVCVTSPHGLFLVLLSLLWIRFMKGCKYKELYNVIYLIWQAIDTVSTGAQHCVSFVCQPQSHSLWFVFTSVHLGRRCPIIRLVNKKSHGLKRSLLFEQSFGGTSRDLTS